jgi:thioredoxin 1
MANLLEVDEKNWDSEVLDSEIPVVVDFWASWCGPCKALAPTLDQIAQELDGKLKIVKCSTETSGDLATRYGVMQIPVLKVFKGGKQVGEILGNRPKKDILTKLEPFLQ